MVIGEKDLQELIVKLKALTEFERKAAEWAIFHWEHIENLCEKEMPLPPEKFEEEIQEAISRQDYTYYALLVYVNIIKRSTETESQE